MGLQWQKINGSYRLENGKAWVTEGAFGKWLLRVAGKTHAAPSLQAAKRAAERAVNAEPAETR
jgi:hypothetical protein